MESPFEIPHEVAVNLKHYVYLLRDPRDKQVFYVGKGVGSRINSHLREAGKDPESERAKIRRIRSIESAGLEVELLFLRTGLEDGETALAIEQSVIDAYFATQHPLTNLVRGHHSGTLGLGSLQTVVARYSAQPCPPIPGPVLMFKIQKGWRPDLTPDEIYEKTRGHWKVSSRVRSASIGGYALGIAFGVVYGVYRIESWFESPQPWDLGKNRWGFVGTEAPELVHVIGTQVRNTFPNQVMYRRYLDGFEGT